MSLYGILHTVKNIKLMTYFHAIPQAVVYSVGEIL